MKTIYNIDTLVIAFRIFDPFNNNQFDYIVNTIEKIDKLNEHKELDLIDYLNTPIIPYQFNKTELRTADKEIKTHYKYNYSVYYDDRKIGLLQWECFGNGRLYGYLTLQNDTLYNDIWKQYKCVIRDLKLQISHISRLDIAADTTVNPTQRYLDIIKDKQNEIYINDKRITNRDELLHSPYFITYGSLDDPLKIYEIHFATRDKSTTLKTYNKTTELKKSKKQYIQDCYKTESKDIYRCEVSLRTHALNRIIDQIFNQGDFDTYEDAIYILLNRLEDKDYLKDLHRKTSLRLFRYSLKRKKRRTLLSYYNYNY